MEKQKLKIPFAERDACTINEFCASIGISRSSYYNMPPEDRPTEMLVNSSKRISREARFNWRRKREQAAKNALAS